MSEKRDGDRLRGGMPITLRRSGGEAAEDAVDLLLACHARIRHFTAVSRALAASTGASPEEIAAAASGVRRYFTEALPLHSADEDTSIAPRLAALDLPSAARAAAEVMTAEHAGVHALVAGAIPIWSSVADEPARLPALRADLEAIGWQLEARWAAHLRPEEQIVFPAIRALIPAETQRVIVAEMRARRARPATR